MMVVTGQKNFVATERKQINSLSTSRVCNGEYIMFFKQQTQARL